MLLSSYDGIALDLSAINVDVKNSLQICAAYEWAYFSGSHACPHCLSEENNAWLLAWKFPWSVACTKHKCYLESHCPACKERLLRGKGDGGLAPKWVSHIPIPGNCTNPVRTANCSTRARSPCNYKISDTLGVSADVTILQIEKLLNGYLSGNPGTILGNQVSSLEYFRNLRALCGLILYCAEQRNLGQLPFLEAAAFEKFADERDRIIAARKESTAPKHFKRITILRGGPESPALIAAVARLAIPILAARDTDVMLELIRPITERYRAKLDDRWRIIKNFGFTRWVADEMSKSIELNSTFDRAVGRNATATRGLQFSFKPQHVPELIWRDEFEQHFRSFFPGRFENTARRYCAMALVRLSGKYTWGQSATQLGATHQTGVTTALLCAVTLTKTGSRKAFGIALRNLAGRLSSNPNKINYTLRRKALSNLKDIPAEQWLNICRAANVPPGSPNVRSRYAATWLWATLTGGDWKHAPALENKYNKVAYWTYNDYCKTVADSVASDLCAYGHLLLKKVK